MSDMSDTELVDFEVHLGPFPKHIAGNGVKLDIKNVDFWYGEKHALKNINLQIYEREVTAFIGPSGCGKTTLLRCLNRSNDFIPGTKLTGDVLLDNQDIYAPAARSPRHPPPFRMGCPEAQPVPVVGPLQRRLWRQAARCRRRAR